MLGNVASDLVLMEAAGKAMGTVHAMPLDWMQSVVHGSKQTQEWGHTQG